MNEIERDAGETWGGNRKDLLYRQLELPLFNGVEALDWISKIERYFQVNSLTELEKLITAGVGMEGDALHWLQWHEKHQPFAGWEVFKWEVLEMFLPLDERSAEEELFSLRQMGSVQDYRSRFELLSTTVDDLSEDKMKIIFMNGLLDEIRSEVKMLHPKTLLEMMMRARQVEKKNTIIDERYVLRPG